ncbi:MAG: Stk1 family PASTA domain-containing Ser/Thr kinase [Thermoleophilia bacterium]|nr:Stk1 family PASTA domain-containing Ser/Thr kinase [Thermoleophilia bacterium]
MTIGPGTELGDRYELGHQIGSGGMATVYLAYDTVLDREVAVKVLAERFAADQAFVERFRREASAAAGLNHPNIVAVYDRGEAEGTYYIVMEYLKGPDLKRVIRDQGPLDPAVAVDNALQILSALSAAHAAGIIHRDIKPQNVMVGEDGRLRVADFGIARADADQQMTEAGSVIGTAQYLSPEQAQGEETTAASDTYAVGIVLYEMLTGRVPFDGDRPVTVAMKQINEPPVPPRVFAQGIPPELDAVVMKALSKRPEDRYTSAEDFTAALLDVRAEMPGGQQSTLILTAPAAGAAAGAGAAATMETQALGNGSGAGRGGKGRGGSTGKKKGGGNRPAVWGIAAVILAALVVALALALTRGGSDMVAVPDVAGFDAPAASRAITDAGLVPTQRTQASDTVQVGVVIGTQPEAGTEVAKESTVTVLVSSGPAEVTVPNVVGEALEDAQATLEKAGFDVATEEVDSDREIGTVVRQAPKAGSMAGSGDTITLYVSKGVTKVSVPSVTGSSLSTARTRITDAGLTVGSVTEDDGSSGQSPGTVVGQDPSGGASVAKGTAVNLVIAAQSGSSVPDVTGSDQSTARNKLESLGFSVTSSSAESTQPEGTVIDQDPQPGSTVPAGSTVTIIVAYPPSSGGGSGSGSTTTNSGGGSSGGGSQPPAPSSGGSGGGSSGGASGGAQPPAPG